VNAVTSAAQNVTPQAYARHRLTDGDRAQVTIMVVVDLIAISKISFTL
jgi:hypothetical protein